MQIKSIHVSQFTLDSTHSVVRQLPNGLRLGERIFEEAPSGRCSALLESNSKLYKISLLELVKELLTSEKTFTDMKGKLKNVVYKYEEDTNKKDVITGILKISVPKNVLTSSGAIGFQDVEAEKSLNVQIHGFKSSYDKTKDQTDIQIEFAAFHDVTNTHFINHKTKLIGKK